tara:strand:- start:2015 stop:2266 length:252 start_codon:yes stop_codon:yes gene_type:complete
MPDYREVKVYIALCLLLVSSLGIMNMSYVWKKGKALRKLQKIKKKSNIVELYIERYEHFFTFKWWHWVSLLLPFIAILEMIRD